MKEGTLLLGGKVCSREMRERYSGETCFGFIFKRMKFLKRDGDQSIRALCWSI